MHISCLLTLTLLSTTALPAQSAPNPDKSVPEHAVPAAPKSASPSTTEGLRIFTMDQLDAGAREQLREAMRRVQTPTQVCYTMQSYRLSRESTASDLTRVTGHSTCLPAQEFQLKRADPAAK